MDIAEVRSRTGLSVKTIEMISPKIGIQDTSNFDDNQVARIMRVKEIRDGFPEKENEPGKATERAIKQFIEEEKGGLIVREDDAIIERKDFEEKVPGNILEEIDSLATTLTAERLQEGTKEFVEGAVKGAFEASDRIESLSLENGKKYAESVVLQKQIAFLHDPEQAKATHDFFSQAVAKERQARKK